MIFKFPYRNYTITIDYIPSRPAPHCLNPSKDAYYDFGDDEVFEILKIEKYDEKNKITIDVFDDILEFSDIDYVYENIRKKFEKWSEEDGY